MIPENPEYKNSRLLTLGDTTAVELYCKCGFPIFTYSIETINGQDVANKAARRKCPGCWQESGFTPDKLGEFAQLLAEDLRQDLIRLGEHLLLVAELTKKRGLEVRLKIKGPGPELPNAG